MISLIFSQEPLPLFFCARGCAAIVFQLVLALRKRWKYVSFFAAVSGPELGAANMASQDAEVAPVLAAAREVHMQRSLDIAWMS